MRIAFAVILAVAACGGPTKGPAANNDPKADNAVETCCCKSNPLTSEDGRPVFEIGNRMECSSKQGECVDEVQCQAATQPE